ncbi:MAG TPA: hypothetical protein VFF73_33460 [Planctomycetota bacterium]|nr:hypothetical protein [Planctomycetota bacterium]
MSESKTAARPEPSVQLLPGWAAYGAALVAFIVAGQTLTTRVREMYDSMNIELPVIAELPTAHPHAVAAAFVAIGLAILGLTRVHVARSADGLRAAAFGLAVLSAVAGAGFVFSSVFVFMKLQQSLIQ